MAARETALLVDRLTKVYADGTHALDGLDLRIPAGSFFGLLGPNGAGKTTLIGSVAGLVHASAGGSSSAAMTRSSTGGRGSCSGWRRRRFISIGS
jgi:ABC-type multidrug transport system ATPase subunit